MANLQKWIGTFTSHQYNYILFNLVYGDIYISLPEDIRQTQNATSYMTYNGTYRYGQTVSFTVNYDPGVDRCAESIIGTSFHAKIETHQHLTFTIETYDDDIISGKYISMSPYDRGEYIIYKKRQ